MPRHLTRLFTVVACGVLGVGLHVTESAARPLKVECEKVFHSHSDDLWATIRESRVPVISGMRIARARGAVRAIDLVRHPRGTVFTGLKRVGAEIQRELLYVFYQKGLTFLEVPKQSIPKRGTVNHVDFTSAIAQLADTLQLRAPVVRALRAHHLNQLSRERIPHPYGPTLEEIPLLVGDVINYFDSRLGFTHIDGIRDASSAEILTTLKSKGLSPTRELTLDRRRATFPVEDIPHRSIAHGRAQVPTPQLRGLPLAQIKKSPLKALYINRPICTAAREAYGIVTIGDFIQFTGDQIRELPLKPQHKIGNGRLKVMETKLKAVGLAFAKPHTIRNYRELAHEGMILGLPVQSLGLNGTATRVLNRRGIFTVAHALRASSALLVELPDTTYDQLQAGLAEVRSVLREKRSGG